METVNIMIVGVGGQGTLLTSRVLGGVIEESGFDVKLSEVHGMAQRGGSVVTFVRFGDKVYEPIVEEGRADILIAFERLEALRYAHFLKKDGIMIINDQRIDPMPVVTQQETYPDDIFDKLNELDIKIISLDAMKEALDLGNARVFNIIVLGVLSNHMDIDVDLWRQVIRDTVPEKTIDINLKAFERGRDLVAKEV